MAIIPKFTVIALGFPDLYIVALDARLIGGDGALAGPTKGLSGFDVEYRGMPRTGYVVTVEIAFDERPSHMGTLVAEGEEAAVDVGNDHLLTLEFDQLHFAKWDLRGLRYRPEVRHSDSSFVDIGASISGIDIRQIPAEYGEIVSQFHRQVNGIASPEHDGLNVFLDFPSPRDAQFIPLFQQLVRGDSPRDFDDNRYPLSLRQVEDILFERDLMSVDAHKRPFPRVVW